MRRSFMIVLASILASTPSDWIEWVRITLASWKDPFLTLGALATIIGFIGGAVWFNRQRKRLPKANITQTVAHRHLHGNKLFVRVTATVVNKGETLIEVQQAFTRLLLVRPCYEDLREGVECGKPTRTTDGALIDWPLLDKVSCCTEPPREVEPGETDEIHFDFVVDDDIQTFVAHTNIKNHAKGTKEFVWERSTLYDLDGEADNAPPEGPTSTETNMASKDQPSHPQSRTGQRPPDAQTRVRSDPRPVVKPPSPEGTAGRQVRVTPDPRPVRKSGGGE